MKRKILSVVVVVAIVAMMLCVLISCTNTKVNIDPEKKVVSFTAEESIIKKYNCEFLIDYMNALMDKKAFTYVANDSTYGKFVVSINDLKADSLTEYWAIYGDSKTKDSKEQEYFSYTTTEWSKPYTLNGKEYGYANLGVSSLPVEAGVTYVFVLTSYTA
ncbi:MAG: hypothetical protein K5765_01945 [Clostridia bacterium]|nr:hypothetical protein [Clostridia bacterium]